MVKRMFDLLFGVLLFIIFMPLLISISFLLWLSIGSPVYFKQLRPGFKGEPFYFYKFRTMTNEKDEQGNLLSDEERLTRVGLVLRKLSLDELPQLINVIKGDLSFVGPRPLLMEYIDRYNNEQARRHDVKPGITGWAQVNGRNALSWQEKFKLDVWYVDNQSFWLDIKILWLTLIKVFKAEGISGEGTATMTKFMGDEGMDDE